MDRQEAIEILEEYQKWRKGEVPNAKGGYWLPSVEQVTQAIDTLIAPMTITDEMVERAINEHLKHTSLIYPKDKFGAMKAALTAALGGDDV